MKPELIELRDAVVDENSFLRFLAVLAQDRADTAMKEKSMPSPSCGTGAKGWEHRTIEGFLESASAWAKASCGGLATYEKPDNPWRRCADILYMGKIYE